MINWLDKFDKVYIQEDQKDRPVSQRFIQLFQDKVEFVKESPPNIEQGPLSASQFSQSKRQIFIGKHPGSFFKKCPGFHKGLACCNYFVLNLGFQCDMDCSYCYLQSFINSNYLTIYSNIEDALKELASFTGLHDQPLRVGTGEVIDSLSLDPLTLYSRELINFFKDYPKWRLEFKTKSDFVDQFLDCEHANNIIVSWSINPSSIVEQEEHKTASLTRRLLAAKKCLDKKFLLAFHIDPIIWHPEWKQNYGDLVDEIATRFSPQDIPYISLGALRFQPQQKNIMRERFGLDSLVTRGETFPSSDGKLRYDYDVRKEMFDFIIKRFKQHDPLWKIFLCMETPEAWIDTFGHSPHREKPLKTLFQPITTKI